MKMASATMAKSTTVCRNRPSLIIAAPAAFAAVSGGWASRDGRGDDLPERRPDHEGDDTNGADVVRPPSGSPTDTSALL
jgi:hypothetical protein